MKFKIFFVTLIAASTALNVEIFIESECKYSKIFIQEQIAPAYKILKNETVQLTFIPFGKSQSIVENSEIYFQCQHGKIECFNNMLMACVMSFFPLKSDKKVEFIICAMGYEKTQIHCAEDVGINKKVIDTCMDHDGVKLQLENEKKSRPVLEKSGHVPTTVFNGIYDADDDFNARINFLGTVREKLKKN